MTLYSVPWSMRHAPAVDYLGGVIPMRPPQDEHNWKFENTERVMALFGPDRAGWKCNSDSFSGAFWHHENLGVHLEVRKRKVIFQMSSAFFARNNAFAEAKAILKRAAETICSMPPHISRTDVCQDLCQDDTRYEHVDILPPPSERVAYSFMSPHLDETARKRGGVPTEVYVRNSAFILRIYRKDIQLIGEKHFLKRCWYQIKFKGQKKVTRFEVGVIGQEANALSTALIYQPISELDFCVAVLAESGKVHAIRQRKKHSREKDSRRWEMHPLWVSLMFLDQKTARYEDFGGPKKRHLRFKLGPYDFEKALTKVVIEAKERGIDCDDITTLLNSLFLVVNHGKGERVDMVKKTEAWLRGLLKPKKAA